MPGPSLELEMRLKDGKVAIGLDQIAGKEEKIDAGLGKISRTAKQADAELSRFAKRTQELHGEPIERYAVRFKKLEDAFAKGKITLVAYSGAMAQTKKEFQAAQAEFDGTTVKLKEQAKATQHAGELAEWHARVVMNSAKLATSEYGRLAREREMADKHATDESAKKEAWLARVKMNSAKLATSEYARLARERETADRRARNEQDKAFSGSALGQITQFAAGYLTLSTAVRLVGDAFRHARQESKEALSSLRSLDDQRRKLAQLASDMPAGALTKMTQRADAAAMASGTDRSKAYEVLFQAHSFGFENEYEQVMGMNPIIDASAAAQLAGKVRSMYGKKISSRETVNMAIEAGKPSEVDAETIAGALAIATEGGRRIGATPEEAMALVSGLSIYYAGRGEGSGEGKSGSARTAADRVRAFSHKVATRRPDLGDKGVLHAFKAIQALPADERADFLKENEEVGSLYAALTEALPNIEQIKAKIVRARERTGAGDNVAIGLGIRQADPSSQASIELRRAELAKELAREGQLGVAAAKREAAGNRAQGAANLAGMGMFQRWGVSLGTGTAEALQLNGGQTAAFGAMGAAAVPGGDTGGFGIWRMIGHLIEQQYLEQRLQTTILQDIKNGGGAGSSRAIQNEALQPLN